MTQAAEQSQAEPAPEPATLSRRERQIIEAIFSGKTSAEVARDLFVSKRTVDFHLHNVYARLGVRNRIQALLRLQPNAGTQDTSDAVPQRSCTEVEQKPAEIEERPPSILHSAAEPVAPQVMAPRRRGRGVDWI